MTDEPGPADEQPSQPLPQHPYVSQLKPDPAQPALRVTELTGLPGDSDRPGYQRLYLTAKLDYYAEFTVADIISAQDIPADQSPFPGLAATWVSIRHDTTIAYTWVKSPQPVDEFDLDVRLGGASGAVPELAPQTAPINTCPTCRTCNTNCGQNTCRTCNTNCGQNTCTCAGQNTCNTCWYQNTCNPENNTCGGQNTCSPPTTCFIVGPD